MRYEAIVELIRVVSGVCGGRCSPASRILLCPSMSRSAEIGSADLSEVGTKPSGGPMWWSPSIGAVVRSWGLSPRCSWVATATRRSRPSYVICCGSDCGARSRVLVVCVDDGVARWAAQTDPDRECVVTPIVVGPQVVAGCR